MSYFLIGCLILMGFAFIALELLVFPGTTLAGVAGLGALGYAVYGTFVHHGNTAGYVMLVTVLLLSIVMLVLILRSKTWRKLELDASLKGRVNEEADALQVGMKGVTVSRLAPMGTVEIDGERYPATALSSFIDQQRAVKVMKVENGKVWVKEDEA